MWHRAVCGIELYVVQSCMWHRAVCGIELYVVQSCMWHRAVCGIELYVVQSCMWHRAVCGIELYVVRSCRRQRYHASLFINYRSVYAPIPNQLGPRPRQVQGHFFLKGKNVQNQSRRKIRQTLQQLPTCRQQTQTDK